MTACRACTNETRAPERALQERSCGADDLPHEDDGFASAEAKFSPHRYGVVAIPFHSKAPLVGNVKFGHWAVGLILVLVVCLPSLLAADFVGKEEACTMPQQM